MTQIPPQQQSAKGFFGSLFDYSFSNLITTKIIKIVYVLLTIFIGLGALAFLITFVSQGGGDVVVGLIGAPIGFVLYMIIARIYLELVIIIFRIGEDVRLIAQRPAAGAYGGPAYQPVVPPGYPANPGYPPNPGFPPGPAAPPPTTL